MLVFNISNRATNSSRNRASFNLGFQLLQTSCKIRSRKAMQSHVPIANNAQIIIIFFKIIILKNSDFSTNGNPDGYSWKKAQVRNMLQETKEGKDAKCICRTLFFFLFFFSYYQKTKHSTTYVHIFFWQATNI